MNANDWKIIQALFLDAAELPPSERQAFLTQSGESERLLEQVRKMLDADVSGTGFAEPPSAENIAKTMSPESYLEGTLLGDFKLFEEIGRGGMGIVYRAQQLSLKREVAVKILPPALAASKLRLARFHREALAASKLDHPGVAPVLAFGEQDGIVYYAMKLVEGPTLKAVLDQVRSNGAELGEKLPHPKDAKSCAKFIRQLLGGLSYIHENSILHRDVKPANILCGAELPTLIDFGLAKDLELSGITGTGDVAGSPHYMSPEQVVSSNTGMDGRTDVYSVGAVLYEMLTLQPPFAGAVVPDIFQKIQEEAPTAPRKLNSDIPKSLELIVLKALEKDPADRYASAAKMADDLARFERGDSVQAKPASLGKKAKSTVLKRRSLLRIGPALLLFGALAGTWTYQQNYGPAALARAVRPGLTILAPGEWEVSVLARKISKGAETIGERIPLGSVGRSGRFQIQLEPGSYRIILQSRDGRYAELHRDLKENSETTLTPRLVELPAIPDAMARIEAATAAVFYIGLEDDGFRPALVETGVEAFLLDRATVTNGQFWTYLQESGSAPPARWLIKNVKDGVQSAPSYLERFEVPPRSDWLDLPAVMLTSAEATAYAEFYGKRLPSQAELTLAFSNCLPELEQLTAEERRLRVNFADVERPTTDVYLTDYLAEVHPSSSPAATLGPNGLIHPLGNVAEWVSTKSTFAPVAEGCVSFGMDCLVQPTLTIEPGSPMPQGMSSPLIGFRCARSIFGEQ